MIVVKYNGEEYEAPDDFEFNRRDLEIQKVIDYHDDPINKLEVSDFSGMKASEVIETIREACNDFDVDEVEILMDGKYFEFFYARKENPTEYYRRLDSIKNEAQRNAKTRVEREAAAESQWQILEEIRQRSIRNQLKELGVNPEEK